MHKLPHAHLAAVTISGIAVFLAALWSTSVLAADPSRRSASGTGYFGCSDSSKSVSITVRKASGPSTPWPLQVPSSYLGYSLNWEGGDQAMVLIHASHPSLGPRPRGTAWRTCKGAADSQSPSTWAPDRFDIRITAESYVGSPLVGFRRPRDEYVQVESPVRGLTHLQHQCMLKLPWPPDSKTPMNNCSYEYWFVPTEQAPGRPLVFRCLGVPENPSASCAATFAFRGHKVTFQFKRDQLARWKEFDSATIELLGRFAG